MIERSESESAMNSRPRRNRHSKQERSRGGRCRTSAKRRSLKLEGLEDRRLLAALPPLPIDLASFDGPRNVGSVASLALAESEPAGTIGLNDLFSVAEEIPLGNEPGQDNTIDLTGSLPVNQLPGNPPRFQTDLDTFAFDLKAGDILDISTFGAASDFSVHYGNGQLWFAINDDDLANPLPDQAGGYPGDSPLQITGNTAFAQVVPEDGRYYLTLSPRDTSGSYTLGLRTYRPLVESLPIGHQQFIFLDFDGGIYAETVFDTTFPPVPGRRIVETLAESLPLLGIEENDTVALNRLIDLTIAEVERQFDYIGLNGNAGDFDRTGIPGDYGITLLNSRDHADPGPHPLVTRVFVGGDAAAVGGAPGLYGQSSTLDVGNFSMDDEVFVVLDAILPGIATVGISNTVSNLEAAADLIALTVSHEAGHSFGLRHTERLNNVVSIIDGNVDIAQDLGVGNDGIYGTLDDVQRRFCG